MAWPQLAPPARHSFAAQKMAMQQDFAATQRLLAQRQSLNAAALALQTARRQKVTPSYTGWQNEAWGFYEQLGEFRYVVDWKSHMGSRVRLRAAKKSADLDEPTIQENGVAVDIVAALASDIGDATQLMADFMVHINVPGECWMIGEETSSGIQQWRVVSSEELRSKGAGYEVIDEKSTPQNIQWRDVRQNSLIVRVWRPSRRLFYMADSPARAALSAMRELELISRHMSAQYLSRLASAGVFIMPDEVQFPVRPEFTDEPDPFVREWIETAAESIRSPGTAAGVLPIPMRVPSEYVDKFKHIDFTLKLDEKINDKREACIRRLAYHLDAPPEVLLGTGGVNHWTAWAIEESGIKAHIIPDIEIICWALTIGYLHPMLKAAGEEPGDWVVWYDASEIVIKPDRSAAATDAYDRFELSGKAFRREKGFDEDDAPTDEELKTLILKKLASQQNTGFEALYELIGRQLLNDTPPTQIGAPLKPGTQKPEKAPPDTQDDAPVPSDAGNTQGGKQAAETRRYEQLLRQASAQHFIRTSSPYGSWTIIHPQDCSLHLFSCPFNTDAWMSGISYLPGLNGLYEIHWGPKMHIEVGPLYMQLPDGDWLETKRDELKSQVLET